MRILVQPEQLRQAAQALRQAQEAWQGQAARLRQVFSGLDWEVRQQLTVEAQVQQAVSLAESLAARAGEQAAFLEAAAARFEQADSQGAQALGAVLSVSAFSAIGGLNLPLGRKDQEQKQATQGARVKGPDLKPADPASYSSCVLYAQARRPDLGPTGGAGGAADYITKYRDKVFQVPPQATDLRDHLAPGYAIVWDRHHPSLQGTDGWTWGHVAIVEEVGPDYVIVSQANWPGKPTMKIERQKLIDWGLYVIP